MTAARTDEVKAVDSIVLETPHAIRNDDITAQNVKLDLTKPLKLSDCTRN